MTPSDDLAGPREGEAVIYAPGRRSLMRDFGRILTIGAGFGTFFVLMLAAKFQNSAFVVLCVSATALSAVLWALGTLELRLIEIRDALGGRNHDAAPDEKAPRPRLIRSR